MSQLGALYQWTPLMARQVPHLRASQAQVVAAFSWGVVASRRCTLRLVAEALPQLGKPDTVERRLQRFVANPRVDWQTGATAVARWVLRRFPARRPLGLVVDEPSLHEAFRGMVVRVASRGRAFPGAGSCYPSGGCGQGQVEGILALFAPLAPAFPAQRRVVIQADRGIGTSPRLLAALAARGWYFLVRVHRQVRVRQGAQSGALGAVVSQPGHQWQGPGEVFKKAGW